MVTALRQHWPEYLIEAACLGLFMIAAGAFTLLLEHPASPARQALSDPLPRRALMGLAMGLTAVTIIYSPWGQRSGAHINPAVTLTFWRLGRTGTADAAFYVVAQFLGGAAGLGLLAIVARRGLGHPSVAYATTVPGPAGLAVAFAAEVAISFVLMLVILTVGNRPDLARYTGLVAGLLVATYITLEAPLSGMSMNPARSFASGVNGRVWTAHWIYFTAPPLGMLAAAAAYLRWRGADRVFCAKLHHGARQRCIFRCRFDRLGRGSQPG